MAKILPNKGDFRKIQPGDPGYSAAHAKARWMFSPSRNKPFTQAAYQKTAGSTAPSRATAAQKLTHAVPTVTHAREAAKVSQTLRNRRAYAEKYGMSLREASKDQYYKLHNKEWKEGLARLQKLEGARKRRDPQTPEEIELRKSMSDIAKSLGRKQQDDYRDFGSTDTIS